MVKFSHQFKLVRCAAACWLAVVLTAIAAPWDQAEEIPALASRVDRDPDLSFSVPEAFFPDGLRDVWTLALKHEEADAKQLAARSIVIANRNGLKEWKPTEPLLLKNLKDKHRAVRLASAAALVELRVLEAAPALANAADLDGLEMSQLVEPALANWKIESRVATWIEWVKSAEQHQGRAKLAMQALGEIGSTEAKASLLQIVIGAKQPSLRIAAARALGAYVEAGLESQCETLSSRGGRGPRAVPRILAAMLLQSHTSDDSINLLNKLLLDDEPSVITAAAVSLNRRSPKRMLAARDHILNKGDANARSLLVESLLALPSSETIVLLGDRLDDVSPSVRNLARVSLENLSDDKRFRTLVTEQARRMLDADSWQATQQAAHLVVHLDDEPSAMRLVKLLEFPRPETYVTAAWALAETNPKQGFKETLEIAERRLDEAIAGTLDPRTAGFERQLAHLFEWLGYAKYAPADEILQRCIPKSVPLIHTRRSAIWGLAYLHEGKPDRAIIEQLYERLADTDSTAPEDDTVRQQCAIALGRMKDKESIATLRERHDIETPPSSPVGDACSWSLNQITGEALPKFDPVPAYRSGFFLERVSD
jgi:HEAT repeat protein